MTRRSVLLFVICTAAACFPRPYSPLKRPVTQADATARIAIRFDPPARITMRSNGRDETTDGIVSIKGVVMDVRADTVFVEFHSFEFPRGDFLFRDGIALVPQSLIHPGASGIGPTVAQYDRLQRNYRIAGTIIRIGLTAYLVYLILHVASI